MYLPPQRATKKYSLKRGQYRFTVRKASVLYQEYKGDCVLKYVKCKIMTDKWYIISHYILLEKWMNTFQVLFDQRSKSTFIQP